MINRPNKPKTDAERRKEADQRKQEQGLTRVTVWVPVERKEQLKELAKRWCDDKD